uniref:Putative lectin n=1 Tax=Hyphantria cunea TaxID=39466 RepID=O96359_HYPCU|nr:putative lectin [Hyphantria cunea]
MCILKCVVLILHFTFLESVKFRCDYEYSDIGWFKYHEIPATWDEARLRCHLEGAVLASPTTDKMKSIMLKLFCKPEVFTGIAAIFSKGDYYTIDGIPLTEIHHEWAQCEPDNKNNDENCTALSSDGKLSDVRCDAPRPYICYREYSKVDVNLCGTPDPDYHFETQTNTCYKFHTKARNFERAHMVCSSEGAHLAIINSEEEAKVIAQIFARYPKEKVVGSPHPDIAVIGYKYWDLNLEWTTIQGQPIQKAGYAKFAPGQPDNFKNHEYCGTVFRTGLLNDGDCDVKYPFICEKKPDFPPVCDNLIKRNHTRFCDNDIQDQENQLDIRSHAIVYPGPVL